MQKKNKQKTWRKFRHKLITKIGCFIMAPVCKWYYGINIEPFQGRTDRPYLILGNHQTPFDQFFPFLTFKEPIYFVATEDIFSLGWISSIIRFAIAPIPIKKQTTDINAVMNCIKVAREGGSIAIFPEGNRTYSGKTEYMSDSIAPLAKKMKLPIALYRIEGGYGTQPRWSDVIRKGSMRAFVSRVIEPEEYAGMTNEELFHAIRDGLYVNEAVEDGLYRSSKRAEYMERCVYVCPFCGLSPFESHGNDVTCTRCGKTFHYGENKKITGNGFESPFTFFNDWYEYQHDFINQLDVTAYTATPMFHDSANISEVIVYKKKVLLHKNASIDLYGNRIEIDAGSETPMVLPFDDLSVVTVLGRNKLNIYHGKQVYQFKGDKRFNAMKYVNIFNRYKNISRGDENGKFLGL